MSEHSYSDEQRAAVYRVIEERRDVRRGFRPDPVPPEVLTRVMAAAHRAPSVGFSQPWDFIVITDRGGGSGSRRSPTGPGPITRRRCPGRGPWPSTA